MRRRVEWMNSDNNDNETRRTWNAILSKGNVIELDAKDDDLRRSTTPFPRLFIDCCGTVLMACNESMRRNSSPAITWKSVAPPSWYESMRPSCPHWFFARYHGSTLKLRNRIGHLFIKLLLAIFLRKLPSVWYNHELAPLFLFRCFLLSQKPVCTRWRTREWHRRTFIMLSK